MRTAALALATALATALPARADVVPQPCPNADLATLVSKCETWVGRDDTAHDHDQSFGVVSTADAAITLSAGYGLWQIVLVSRDAATGAQRWRSVYSEGWGTQPRDVAITPDGATLVVTGLSLTTAGASQMLTVGYDAATGARRWVNHWQSPWARGDLGYAVTVSPDGATAYAAGTAAHYAPGVERGDDIALVAVDTATGATRWSATWDSVGEVGNHQDLAWTVAASPDGDHVVVGGRAASTGLFDQWGIAYGYHFATLSFAASTGALEWHRQYTGGAGRYDEVNDIAFTPDSSTVFVTGDSHGGGGYQRATVAYALGTGTQLWESRHTGPTGGVAFGAALAVSPDGARVYVTGESVGAGTADVSTQALSVATGGQVWEARYTSPTLGGSISSDLAVSPDGSRIYVSGAGLGVASGWNFLTLAYDTTGFQQWVARYTPPVPSTIGTTQQDNDTELAVSPSGDRLFVSGTSDGGNPTGWDAATLGFAT